MSNKKRAPVVGDGVSAHQMLHGFEAEHEEVVVEDVEDVAAAHGQHLHRREVVRRFPEGVVDALTVDHQGLAPILMSALV